MHRSSAVFFFAVAAAASGSPASAAGLHYRAYRTPEAMVMDGKPDEAVWSRVPHSAPIKLAKVHGDHAIPTRADSAAQLYAKAVWDATALYVYFWVDEPYVWSRRSGRDMLGFWMENAVEIYLDDIGDNKRFLEVNMSPNGSITDIYNETKYSGTGSNTVLGYDVTGIATGISVKGTHCTTFSASEACNKDSDTGFGLEVKLPFASLKAIGPSRIDVVGPDIHLPPRNLDSCRIGFFYTSCPPKATEPDNNDRINFNWELDAGNDFHETSKYGTLTLVDTLLTGPSTLHRVSKSAKARRARIPTTLSGRQRGF